MKMTTAKIMATKQDDAVICTFCDGRSIEINMVSAKGDGFDTEVDTRGALNLLRQHLGVIERAIK